MEKLKKNENTVQIRLSEDLGKISLLMIEPSDNRILFFIVALDYDPKHAVKQPPPPPLDFFGKGIGKGKKKNKKNLQKYVEIEL